MKRSALFLSAVCCLSSLHAADADSNRLDEVLRDGFTYRNLGPFRAGSWIADIAVPDTPAKSHLYTFYVAPRNGGVWKTTNNGTTFEPVFDGQNAPSSGAIAVAPSNENIIWFGTGDASCTRSATTGNGVYKSTDAGKTWQHCGLEDTHHVARIVIHPSTWSSKITQTRTCCSSATTWVCRSRSMAADTGPR